MQPSTARILIVEDDDVQREAIRAVLESAGHEVVDSNSCEQALEHVKGGKFDLMVTDIRLPGQSGIELVRLVRAVDPSLCAIAVTLYADIDAAVHAMREGAIDFVAKPFHPSELLAAVSRALGYHAIKKRNELLRIQLEDRFLLLQETNEQLNEFAGRVAHDLRSPVRSTRLWLEFAKEAIDSGDTAEAKKYIDSALRSIGSGSNIIDGLLALSKSSLLELKRERFSLRPMLDTLVASFKVEFRHRLFDVDIQLTGAVTADVVLIGIAVSNLVHNAFKYSSSQEDPHIEILAGPAPAGGYSISVRDNGIGIEHSQKDRLFKPFERLDAAKEFSGEGIGLTTVKKVVDKHGGTVTIESATGMGTTVTICLPASVESAVAFA